MSLTGLGEYRRKKNPGPGGRTPLPDGNRSQRGGLPGRLILLRIGTCPRDFTKLRSGLHHHPRSDAVGFARNMATTVRGLRELRAERPHAVDKKV